MLVYYFVDERMAGMIPGQETIKILGMESDEDGEKAKLALERTPGVFSVSVSLKNSVAEVIYDQETVPAYVLYGVIEEAGFRTRND